MEDQEGDLWVGTETGGLHILRDQRFHLMGARDGLSSDEATTVVEDESRTLWVGTAASGLNAVKPGGGVKTYTVKDGLLSDVILSLAAGQHGELWAGTPDLSLIHILLRGADAVHAGAAGDHVCCAAIGVADLWGAVFDGDGAGV